MLRGDCQLRLEGASWWHLLGNQGWGCAEAEAGSQERLALGTGGASGQVGSLPSASAEEKRIPELLEPFRGLADPAIASLSPAQEGEVELWLLEQSADFLPST